MGLFDDVVTGFGAGQSQGGILDLVLNHVNSPNVGGLAGLVQMFASKGLSEVVKFWVSTGQNLSIVLSRLRPCRFTPGAAYCSSSTLAAATHP